MITRKCKELYLSGKYRMSPAGLFRIAGILLILLAGIGIVYPLWWNHRSSTVGGNLIKVEKAEIQQAARSSSAGSRLCSSSQHPPGLVPALSQDVAATSTKSSSHNTPAGNDSSSNSVYGLLEAPAIHLVAPVKSGTSNATLSVAVGHSSATSWPAPGVPSMFLAHDVSWFSDIGNLTIGDTVLWVEPCSTMIYKVAKSMIRSPGQPIPSYPGGDIVLVTCYPTNALWFTPNRYVVIGEYARTINTGSANTGPSSGRSGTKAPSTSPISVLHSTQLPHLDLPPGLVGTGITLQDNEVLLGHLHIDGTPAASLTQSPIPLDVANRGLKLYFAAMHAAAQYKTHPAWWNDIAPQVTDHSSWANAGPLNITEYAKGSAITEISLCSPVKTVNESIVSHTLVVSSMGPSCS
ncbi:MAG: hypothetical protein M1399_07885 [Actinobacteria bacterium]|nr:hypothetical protein [Actinomycetota bacterium]MCL5447064.1 hypothetical protein [Actinomycetota bacterium]